MISVITLCLLAGCNQEELPQATIEGPDAATVREITKFKFSTDGDAVDRLIVPKVAESCVFETYDGLVLVPREPGTISIILIASRGENIATAQHDVLCQGENPNPEPPGPNPTPPTPEPDDIYAELARYTAQIVRDYGPQGQMEEAGKLAGAWEGVCDDFGVYPSPKEFREAIREAGYDAIGMKMLDWETVSGKLAERLTSLSGQGKMSTTADCALVYRAIITGVRSVIQ